MTSSLKFLLIALISLSPASVLAQSEPSSNLADLLKSQKNTTSKLKFTELVLSPDKTTGDQLLKIDVLAESRCMFGDLDAIMLELRERKGEARLQLSLEPMVATVGKSIRVATPEERKGAPSQTFGSFSVSIPSYEEPTLLGIFICSISAGDEKLNKPCSEKQLLTIEEAMSPYKVEAKEAFKPGEKPKPAPFAARTPKVQENKIFFFGFAVAVNNKFLVAEAGLDDSTYGGLIRQLKEMGADVTNFNQLEIDIHRYNSTLGSMPVTVRNETLNITLPHYSPKKCQGTSN